jgi:hypothetical protein
LIQAESDDTDKNVTLGAKETSKEREREMILLNEVSQGSDQTIPAANES